MTADSGVRSPWAAALAGGVMAALFWSPFVFTPFLQDDFKGLQQAAEASRQGAPWLTLAPVPDMPHFWRPLSTTVYWRAMYEWFGWESHAVHAVNLLILALAAAFAGWVSILWAQRDLASQCPSPATIPPAPRPAVRRAAFWTALLYGVHSAFFLPAAWASAVQELFALLFGTLFLGTSLRLADMSGGRMPLLRAAVALLFLLGALASKEGTVVLLPLAAILLWGKVRPKAPVAIAAILCMALLAAWLAVRQTLVSPPPSGSPYHLSFGLHVLRNGGALVLFGLNLPREAILLATGPQAAAALVWGSVCVILQVTAAALLLLRLRAGGQRLPWIRLALFALVALGPYLLLAWNCYPYYALLALLVWPYLIARAVLVGSPRSLYLPVGLALGSSVLLAAGELVAPYPAPVARAQWGAQERHRISRHSEAARVRQENHSIYVLVKDANRFGALGSRPGIAQALNVPPSRVIIREPDDRPPPASAPTLIITADNWFFR